MSRRRADYSVNEVFVPSMVYAVTVTVLYSTLLCSAID